VQLDRPHNLDVSAECKVVQRGRQSACRYSPVEESSPYIEILTRRDSLTSQESQLGQVDLRSPSWRPLTAGAAARDRADDFKSPTPPTPRAGPGATVSAPRPTHRTMECAMPTGKKFARQSRAA
jgi:hypothetical protein